MFFGVFLLSLFNIGVFAASEDAIPEETTSYSGEQRIELAEYILHTDNWLLGEDCGDFLVKKNTISQSEEDKEDDTKHYFEFRSDSFNLSDNLIKQERHRIIKKRSDDVPLYILYKSLRIHIM